MRESEATTYGPHRTKKKYVGSVHNGLVQKSVSIVKALKIPETEAAMDK